MVRKKFSESSVLFIILGSLILLGFVAYIQDPLLVYFNPEDYEDKPSDEVYTVVFERDDFEEKGIEKVTSDTGTSISCTRSKKIESKGNYWWSCNSGDGSKHKKHKKGMRAKCRNFCENLSCEPVASYISCKSTKRVWWDTQLHDYTMTCTCK